MCDHRALGPTVIAVALASLVAFALVVGAVTAMDPAEPAVEIDLDETGDATVTVQMVFALADDAERAAFEELRDDEDAKADLEARFADRMAMVADAAAGATDREMAIHDASIDLKAVDDHGVVRLSVAWTNFAAVGDGTLTVDEPLASGFEADRPLVIVVPEGYHLDVASPEPDEVNDETLRWDEGRDLSGFSATLLTSDDADATPGFGLAIGAVGIGALGVILHRRLGSDR